MELDKLEPCPFCGSDRVGIAENHGWFGIECAKCKSSTNRWLEREDDAASRWNTRAPPRPAGALDPRAAESKGGEVSVIAERRRQVETEGWTVEHDDAHDMGEMADAAASYAMRAKYGSAGWAEVLPAPPRMWPWDSAWWKLADERRMLVKAGALILAEIERVDRKSSLPAPPLPAQDGGASE